MEIGYAPSRIEGWLSLIECSPVEDNATSVVESFLNLNKSWQSHFCVLLIQEQKLIYCPSEMAARRDIPLARGINSIRLGDSKKTHEERLSAANHVSKSAYEKDTDMGSSISRGEGEPLSVDQDEDCQSTPSRIASFFGRKILRSQLKRTKSANKLDRRISELPAERHHTLPAAPTTCSCTSSLTRTLSLRRKLRDNRPLSSDMTDPYTESTDSYSPLSSSKSQECLSASQATLQKVDLSGGGVEVQPLHSSLTGGQEHCFQLTTAHGSTFYSCRSAKERQHWIQFLRKSIHPTQEQTRRTENSLTLWILEAKQVPGKKKYFCEFFLDKALYGRTSIKPMGDILFWGERFDFSHLPAAETLTVHLYRELSKKRKKESGRQLIGYLHVPLSELKGNQAVEKWFSMSSAVVGKDTRSTDVPQVRLKARYITTAVLPTILYADLIAYLQQHCQQLVDVLEPVLGIKAKDELASTLMNVMQRMNLATGFLTDIIVAEVARLDNNHLMFRGNSIATKAMETYMRLVGDKYIKDTLSDLTSTILQSSDSCEVDPAKLNGTAALSKHQESLTMYCDMIWLKIISSYHYFPRELQEVFHAVRKRCADINRADITDNLISSCIFLRCLCPAILSPSLWGLVQEFPDEKSVRTLTLIAKTIQSVANCSRFENKEFFMTFLNDFVEREISNMKTFLHKISMEPKDSGNNFDGYIDLGRELSLLHAILSDSINKLEDNTLISLKAILADISEHMSDPSKADKLASNGSVLHDIFVTPSNAKHLASSYSANRTRTKSSPNNENGNGKKPRGTGKVPKYSTVEDCELVTTVDVQPTSDYLQPAVSSVLCHRPDPRADPGKLNESWNKIVSAADMVNGDYVDLISFIDDSEAHRRSVAAATSSKQATDRQFVQLPNNPQASSTVPRTGSATNSHLRTTVNGLDSAVSPRRLHFTNPGFSYPASGYHTNSVHISRDHLSVSEASLPRSQDSLYSRSYEKLSASFQKASYTDSVCSTCGQQKDASSMALFTGENGQQQEVCSACGSVWRHRLAGERVKTITSLPSPVDGFSAVSSEGRSSWRSSATPTQMKMGVNSIERQRQDRDKTKLEYEQELLTLKDELARTQAMLAESQMRLKVAEERSLRSSESEDLVGPMHSVERRRVVEPAGQRVRSLDAANSRLLAALSDLSEPHTNLLSGSIMTSTLL